MYKLAYKLRTPAVRLQTKPRDPATWPKDEIRILITAKVQVRV